MTDRQKLLRKIQTIDFALFEVALYLDTHKTDKEALAYYSKNRMESKKLHEEFTSKYGPLTIADTRAEGEWEWSNGPWPWEYAANER